MSCPCGLLKQGLPHQSTHADEEAEKDEERTEFTWQVTHHLTHWVRTREGMRWVPGYEPDTSIYSVLTSLDGMVA